MGLLKAGDWQAKWIAATRAWWKDLVPPRLPGYHAQPAAKVDDMRWVQVDLGTERVIDGGEALSRQLPRASSMSRVLASRSASASTHQMTRTSTSDT